jgi:mobilization protein
MTRKVRDNGAEACIHFQKAETIAFYHNSREAFKPETSHAELEKMNECDKTAEEARELFEKLSAQGDENFLKNCGRRTNMKAENKLWESALNLRERHTMADVQRVNKKIQEITGFIPIQTAIHRDEGHVDEKTGDFILNVHAQTTWLTQDPLTGKSLAYLLFGQKDVYRKIQDIVAEELGMTRGKPAEITGAKHFRNMRDFKQMKRAESKLNKEWEQKLEKNNSEWEAKMAEKQAEWEARKAEWEAKQAEREARREEWERKLPEIMEARRRNEQFLNGRVDWETLKTANRAFLAWHDISTDLLGYPNPNGNLLIEQSKGALASIFRLFGSVSQLAIFLLTRTEARELKLQNTLNVYKVSENLQRAINLVKNDTTNDHVKIVEKIQNIYNNLPHDKRAELIELAILHAPNSEIREDLRALVEGRFDDIARSEQAQKRIENRDLRQELKEYSEEIKRIRDELREMDEENRILNLAEREILKSKGANREQYAEQEAQNRERLDEIKKLKDEAKQINNTIREQKQREEKEKDAEIIKKQAEKIEELTSKIAEISAENAKKQRELEEELEQEKAKRKEAEIITPKQLEDAFNIIDDLEQKLKQREEQKPEPIREEPKIEPVKIEPEPKIEQKPELKIEKPEPEPIKKDDFTNIYGYDTPKPEPRRRFDYEPRKREIDDRPKYEPEPKIEPEREEPIFRDPWQKIEEAMEKWRKLQSEVDKNFLKTNILRDIEKYEKSGWDIPLHRQLTLDSFRRAASYDPAEAINRERERELETERKRQQAEVAIKYEEVKTKSVKQQEDDARQTSLKKKRKDELEMGMG